MFLPWNKRAPHAHRLLMGIAAAALAAFILPCSLQAELDPTASRSWEEPAQATLKFQYRLFPSAEVEKIEITQDGKPLPFRHTPFANNPMNTSAILVLVDTSVGSAKAPRDRTVNDNKQFVQALLSKAQSRNLIGVAAFANDLTEVAPMGAPFPEISQKLGALKATGLGTRIYHSGIAAVEKLAATQGSRKALIILSDGKDEDTGFTKEDLIKAAQKKGVMVFALGCPETETEVPALGSLEKIATETRGLYAQAQPGSAGTKERLKTDADFAQAVLDSVDSGGEIVMPIEGIVSKADVIIDITTKAGEKFSYVHKRPENDVAQPATGAVTIQPAASPAPARPVVHPKLSPAINPPEPSAWAKNDQMAYAIKAGAIVLLLASILLLRRGKPHPPKEQPAPPQPLAYLEMQDADSRRIPLFKPANRIGRRPDNDIVFSNTCISGYHAEIHTKRDGTFFITDLGSGNGVNVNDERILQSADLKDGDLVELGEVRFRFHLS